VGNDDEDRPRLLVKLEQQSRRHSLPIPGSRLPVGSSQSSSERLGDQGAGQGPPAASRLPKALMAGARAARLGRPARAALFARAG
jgi:hypothetical protein